MLQNITKERQIMFILAMELHNKKVLALLIHLVLAYYFRW